MTTSKNVFKFLWFISFATFIFALSLKTTLLSSKSNCSATTCGINGKCQVIGNSSICVCNPGFNGTRCEQCFGRLWLNSSNGYISDGPNNYLRLQKCSFLIHSEKNYSVTIRLDHFETECNWDHVSVYDGDSIYAPRLAAYSGIIQTKDVHPIRVRELQSTGSDMFLRFESDSAYIMPGFNITFRTDSSCLYNCSGRGACTRQQCLCEAGFQGRFCEIETCPGNCSGKGICTPTGCQCFSSYAGQDCSDSTAEGAWYRVLADNAPPPSTSAQLVQGANHSTWLVAGLTRGENVSLLHRYNLRSNSWVPVYSDAQPLPRYGHSAVYHENLLLVFGGTVNQRVVGELWLYNTSSGGWRQASSPPAELAVTGHSAHLVDGRMLVFFGYSPLQGYLHHVQRYDIESDTWHVLRTGGAHVTGSFAHASAYQGRFVYVYGGIRATGATSATSFALTDHLLEFSVDNSHWRVLRSSGFPVALHSIVAVGGSLFSVAGNMHNDSKESTGSPCYTNVVRVYDMACGHWYTLNARHTPSVRYGQSLLAYGGSALLVGGFDGELLGDMYKFTPGECGALRSAAACEKARHATRCYWRNSKCLPASSLTPPATSAELSRACNYYSPDTGLESEVCELQNTCRSCLNNANDCVWCDDLCSKHSKCSTSTRTTDVQRCPADEFGCLGIVNCQACDAAAGCRWKGDRCERANGSSAAPTPSGNSTAEEVCPAPCSARVTCKQCAQGGCIWCGRPALCVDENAYVTNFPYSQCLGWANHVQQCTGPVLGCNSLRTCSECLHAPGCGWCNHANDTGLGWCANGAPAGPQNIGPPGNISQLACPKSRWNYLTCPACQCNGHSECFPGTSQCKRCEKHTTGERCQTCVAGYYGNALNGGTCHKCECNRHGSNCDSLTGQCQCTTRGVIGKNCETCDVANRYFGDPKVGTCYYNVSTDYQFTFNLSPEQDPHVTQINLMNTPHSPDKDVELSVLVSMVAKMNITITQGDFSKEKLLLSQIISKEHNQKFKHGEGLNFGRDNVTFRLYIYGFRVPFRLQVSFSQQPQIKLVNFFVTFFSCFLSIIIIAAIVWRVKMHYDTFRRQQRLQLQLETLASRPFARLQLDLTRAQGVDALGGGPDHVPLLGSAALDSGHSVKRRPVGPAPAAIEPLTSGKAGVLSVLMSLPTGEDDYTPPGQSGLAVASTLVVISNHRKGSLEAGRTDRARGRRPGIPFGRELRTSANAQSEARV